MNTIFPTISQDTTNICTYFFGKKCVLDKAQSRARTEEVTRAAVRMIAIIAIAYSAFTALTFLPFLASEPVRVVLAVAIKVLFCAIAYDVFTILKNTSDQTDSPFKQGVAVISSSLKDAADLLTGRKTLEDESRHPLTEGTFFRRAWDRALGA